VIGFLNQESAELTAHVVAGFRKGLSETGFVENQNVAIEYHWAEGHYERLPQLAVGLVNRKVAVIAAAYFPATLAAKAAMSTIPIVFISGVDPIAAGLVAILNRPGGNLTGVSNFNTSLTAKRLELLQQVVPRGGSIVVLVNSTSPATRTIESEARSAAQALGVRLDVLAASTEDEIDAAFVAAAQRGAGGLLVAVQPDRLFRQRSEAHGMLLCRAAKPVLNHIAKDAPRQIPSNFNFTTRGQGPWAPGAASDRDADAILPTLARASRMRSSACDTLSRSCARRVLCWLAFPSASALRSTDSAAGCPALFVGFPVRRHPYGRQMADRRPSFCRRSVQ
jgi:ABC transporter substrate binding protein